MNNRRTVLGLLAAAALTLCLSLPGFAPAADAAEASPAAKPWRSPSAAYWTASRTPTT